MVLKREMQNLPLHNFRKHSYSRYLPAILAISIYAAWCLRFIWKTSFTINDQRYFCLFDDAMISLTYARNFIEGHGFTWARWGEPVEGFTHPLWAFAMLLSQWPPVPLPMRPLLVQLASMLFLIFNVLALHRLVRKHLCAGNPGLAWVASITTACYFPLNYWALMGMESSLQALLITLSLWYAFEIADSGSNRILALWITLTLLALLRLDMLLVAGILLTYILCRKGLRPHEHRSWIKGLCIFITLLSGYQIFRLAYYGDWLPNTYYLKMTGGDPYVRIMRGWLVFLDLMPSIIFSLALAAIVTLSAKRNRPKLTVVLTVVMTYLAYSIYIGGDVWESSAMTGNRFQVFVIPLLAVIIAGGADLVLSHASRFRALAPGIAALLTIFLVLNLNGLLSGKGKEVRNLNGVSPGHEREVRLNYLLVRGAPYHVPYHKQVTYNIINLQAQAPRRIRVACVWAGIPSYYSDFEMVDILGYNDREIAKRPWAVKVPRDQARNYIPGHMKYNLVWTMKNRKPVILFQWWPGWGAEEQQLLSESSFIKYIMGPFIQGTSGEMWFQQQLHLPTE